MPDSTFLQHEQRHGTRGGTDDRAHAAQHDHHDQVAGCLPRHVRRRGELREVREQHAGDHAHQRRDHVGDEPVAQRGEAERRHPPLVAAAAAQYHAEARADEAVEGDEKQDQHAEGDVVEDGVARQREDAEVAARRDCQPVVAAVLLQADREEVDHLRERERDHDESDAAGAQAHETDDDGERGADHQRDGELRPAVADAVKRQDADGVRADADIHRVAEADHRAVAQDQVEADRGDREDHDAREQRDVIRLADRRGERRHQREPREQHRRDDAAGGHPRHRHLIRAAPGTGPAGVIASTTAINT